MRLDQTWLAILGIPWRKSAPNQEVTSVPILSTWMPFQGGTANSARSSRARLYSRFGDAVDREVRPDGAEPTR